MVTTSLHSDLKIIIKKLTDCNGDRINPTGVWFKFYVADSRAGGKPFVCEFNPNANIMNYCELKELPIGEVDENNEPIIFPCIILNIPADSFKYCGQLKIAVETRFADPHFPDGFENTVSKYQPLNIMLI